VRAIATAEPRITHAGQKYVPWEASQTPMMKRFRITCAPM